MAVYVDNYDADFRGMVMCHMMADTKAELLAMADKIGVKRKWIQAEGKWSEHFDVCKSKRALAVRAGAVEMSPRDLVALMMKTKGNEKQKAVIAELEANEANT